MASGLTRRLVYWGWTWSQNKIQMLGKNLINPAKIEELEARIKNLKIVLTIRTDSV